MKPLLLNLGCGKKFHPDWHNVDFVSTGPDVISHDLCNGIPFDDNSFDAVYHSHLLEHLPKSYANVFLDECFRVLKPNGILRVVVPDLEQIARIYIDLLEKSINGDREAQDKYDWILLELFDQMVRNHPGGEMLNYWKKRPMPAESFVIERQGSEVSTFIDSFRKTSSEFKQREGSPIVSPENIGKFRLSGEIHQWMYDRHSLGKLLCNSGFDDIKVCSANESDIRAFNSYCLDTQPDGSVRKPDSLFMEAVKKDAYFKSHSRRNRDTNLNIVHLCMQDFGGAGKASYRLHKGLQSVGVDSTMLVLNKRSGDPSVKVLPSDYSGKKENCLAPTSHSSPIWNRQLQTWLSLMSAYPNRPGGLEMFTGAESTVRLDLINEIQEADIVNLHWVAGIFDYSNIVLSLKDTHVVWTLHDMNPFTGGCHYAGDCHKYKTSCQACPQLGSDNAEDLSRQVWTQKHYTTQNLEFDIVTPSRWLGRCARESALFSKLPIHVIPYGFPLEIFKPLSKATIRRNSGISESVKIILFGADSVTNQRKGFSYLLEALNGHALNNAHEYILMTFGSIPEDITIHSKYKLFNAGKIADENQLAMLYSMADLFVLPSLEDNLPNTVIEAMACGLPVVGFNIGGVPDMVKHKQTGYLAKPKESIDLIKGINWIISAYDDGVDFTRRCRQHVEKNYAADAQALAYKDLYRKLRLRK